MTQTTIQYFEAKGPENTARTLEIAIETARTIGIAHIVLASTYGTTAEMLANAFDLSRLTITIVTHAYGSMKPNWNPFPEELRKVLTERGFRFCTAAHALSTGERALSTSFHGVYPLEIIAHTLRMFGQGMKVCVEIAAMAADAGLVPSGEPIVVVGGSGRGADTAVILRPQVSSNILKTKIDRILCKPIE